MKLSQWTKLFTKFISSSLQILDIFGIQEGRIFELQNLSNLWVIRKMIVHRIGPGPVLQSLTRGRFQTVQRLSELWQPPTPLFSDCHAPPVGSDHATVFHAHVHRPHARLYHLRAQRRMLPFRVLLFMLPIALPCPPSTTVRTGRFDLPLRLPWPQWPLPELTASPRPPSRRPPPLLWPAAGGPPPPCASPSWSFSGEPPPSPVTKSAPTSPAISLTHGPTSPRRCSPEPATAAAMCHDPSALPISFRGWKPSRVGPGQCGLKRSVPYLFPLILV
jgi:hypothetical protein